MEENFIDYKITLEQAEKITKYFKFNIDNMEDYEICECLDKIIDNLEP